jgi:hypothetical protein
MGVWDIAGEINDAIKKANCHAKQIFGLDVEKIRKELEANFARGSEFWPLWEVLDDQVSVQGENLWVMVGDYRANQQSYLLFNPKDEASMFAFEKGSDIPVVLSDCFAFEFYITDGLGSYLICFNHHDFLIAAGKAKEWLSGIKEKSGINVDLDGLN